MHASGYKPDHVHGKLGECFQAFPDGSDRRLDLIIGTHYDKDHLAGLVPIIEDATIDIGEAWMPPVADDSARHSSDTRPRDRDFLAVRFASEEGEKRFRKYLGAKARDCEEVLTFERAAREAYGSRPNRMKRVEFGADLAQSRPPEEGASIEAYRAFFNDQFTNASTIAGISEEHADEAIDPPTSLAAVTEDLRRASYRPFRFPFRIDSTTALAELWEHDGADAGEHALRFAEIRRSAAADAITRPRCMRLSGHLSSGAYPSSATSSMTVSLEDSFGTTRNDGSSRLKTERPQAPRCACSVHRSHWSKSIGIDCPSGTTSAF